MYIYIYIYIYLYIYIFINFQFKFSKLNKQKSRKVLRDRNQIQFHNFLQILVVILINQLRKDKNRIILIDFV